MSKEERMDYLRRKKAGVKTPLEKSIGQRENESIESPLNLFGTEYDTIPFNQLPEWKKNAVRAADKEEGGRGSVRAVGYPKSAIGGGEAVLFAAELFKMFRKRIAFVATGTGKPLSFEGFVNPSYPNTIIVDADAYAGWSYLLGHELGHSIQHQQPDLYNALRDTLLGMAKDWSGYRASLPKVYDTKEKQDAEFVNDFIGNQFGEPDFWAELKRRDKSVFGKLVGFALDYLKSIGGRIESMNRDVRPYFDNIEAARTELVKALEAYQRGEASRHSCGDVGTCRERPSPPPIRELRLPAVSLPHGRALAAEWMPEP